MLHWACRESDVGLLSHERVNGASATNGKPGLSDWWRLAGIAAAGYQAGDLPLTRRVLETMLVLDGDYPPVLRNLITVASEQQDAEAYCRYWHRYVTLLLWRIMREDRGDAAYDELLSFYVRVSGITDREFSESGPKLNDRLRTPGLLAKWLESHAALVWLEVAECPFRDQQTALSAADRQNARLGRLAVMRYWYRVFYPEFLPFLDVGNAPATEESLHRRRAASYLMFDPSETLLTRFVEWSRFQFGLKNDEDEHAQIVTALSGFAARLPLGVVACKDDESAGQPTGHSVDQGKRFEPSANRLNRMLSKGEVDPPPFRRLFQDACSLALHFPLGNFLKNDPKNWAGLIEFYGDPDLFDRLSPDLRLFVALGHCIEGRATLGFDVACRTLPDLRPDDLKEDAQCRHLWKNVVHANLQEFAELDASQLDSSFAELRQRVETSLQGNELESLRIECLREIDEAATAGLLKEQVGHAIEKSKSLVGKGKFAEAKKAIRDLPDSPADLRDLKKNFLGQIDDVEKQASRAGTENVQIMSRLAAKNIDISKLFELANQNNVNPGNALEWNGFLKAVERQL
ncbi:MAG: hypothetical protein ABI614_09245 [Planctomycetota bacterium]